VGIFFNLIFIPRLDFGHMYSKTQWVRLVDIFVYGPYLIYLSTKDDYTFSEYEKLFLLFLGATTITYNARNYKGNRL
jgi:hypothetical protein